MLPAVLAAPYYARSSTIGSQCAHARPLIWKSHTFMTGRFEVASPDKKRARQTILQGYICRSFGIDFLLLPFDFVQTNKANVALCRVNLVKRS